MAAWNPWHGCQKISAGCENCYVYRMDRQHGRDASQTIRNKDFDLPLRRDRKGNFKLLPGETVYTCFTSDFFLEQADPWREEAWECIRGRPDLLFFMATKRIDRLEQCVPADWGEGYENVHICCTVENQDRAAYRLPIFLPAPIRHKSILCEPLLEAVELTPWLNESIEEVAAGGESGPGARLCDYDWILSLQKQCKAAGTAFCFRQTGALFRRNGRLYRIPRKHQHSQARKAGIDLARPQAFAAGGQHES